MLENVIKISTVNNVNVQLKGINIIMDALVEGIKKAKEKAKNLLNENNNDENRNKKNKNNYNNYITAEIIIKEHNINKNVRILNSYEECLRTEDSHWFSNKKYKNEDEMKKCEIKINDKLIPFNYFYTFKSKGQYIIQYSFKKIINNTCYMFSGCSSLTNINLSNFNSNHVTNMRWMFFGCFSLINIDLSNFNTNNVTNMSDMFSLCKNLNNLDLSSFNTKNVNNMKKMFFNCVKLNSLDLSSFDIKNVTNIDGIFFGCPKKIVDYNKSKFGKFEYDDLINSKNF